MVAVHYKCSVGYVLYPRAIFGLFRFLHFKLARDQVRKRWVKKFEE